MLNGDFLMYSNTSEDALLEFGLYVKTLYKIVFSIIITSYMQ